MNRIVIVALLGSLFLTSCKKELGLFRGNDKKFSVNDIEFDYMTSKAKFKFDNGRQKLTAAANFRVRQDSIIWVSIAPVLGVELARVVITPQGIRAIDKLKRDYYEYDFAKLSELYGFQITYELVESIALGNSLFLPERRKQISEDAIHFKYGKQETQYGIDHHIGRESKKLEKLYAYDTVTYNSVSVNYGEFQPIEGQIIPQSIQATVNFAEQDGKEPVSITIEYNRTELRKESVSFPFNVSSKYTRK